MPSHTRLFKRDDGTIVEVDGNVISEGRGLGYYFDEYQCWRVEDSNDVEAPLVTLTESEDVRLNEEVGEDSGSIESDLMQGDW